MIIGAYCLNQYCERQAFIEKGGRKVLEQDQPKGLPRDKIIDTILLHTWWGPSGFLLIGFTFCIASFLKDDDKKKK